MQAYFNSNEVWSHRVWGRDSEGALHHWETMTLVYLSLKRSHSLWKEGVGRREGGWEISITSPGKNDIAQYIFILPHPIPTVGQFPW